jgi:hypothetical protein
MARARMLSKTISTDARVRELPCPGARLLFTWMIAHADNCGRMRAEAAYVRATVVPHEQGVTDENVEQWLLKISDLGLIDLYTRDGGRYLEFRAWAKHQRLDRMKKSDLPPPPEDNRKPLLTDREPRVAGREGDVDGEVEVEGEGENERGGRRGTGKREPNYENTSLRGPHTTAPTEGPPPVRSEKPHPPYCACEICIWKGIRR